VLSNRIRIKRYPQIRNPNILLLRCKELGIKKLESVKEAANNNKTKKKREEFNLKKYWL